MSSCVLIIEWKVQTLMLSFLFFFTLRESSPSAPSLELLLRRFQSPVRLCVCRELPATSVSFPSLSLASPPLCLLLQVQNALR